MERRAEIEVRVGRLSLLPDILRRTAIALKVTRRWRQRHRPQSFLFLVGWNGRDVLEKKRSWVQHVSVIGRHSMSSA